MSTVQLDFFLGMKQAVAPRAPTLLLGAEQIPLTYVRNPRARRYILRIGLDGLVRVTIPRGGSKEFALSFAQRNTGWIAKQLQRRKNETLRPTAWSAGSEIWFRGEEATLTVKDEGEFLDVRFADQSLTAPSDARDLRPFVVNHLWTLAAKELGSLTLQLASQHQLRVARVVVRNQRSRWGSCSPRRTISLNWRLIQAPAWVRDYLIIHELMHLREMNHSARFWQLVETACPSYTKAEAWLDTHAFLLR